MGRLGILAPMRREVDSFLNQLQLSPIFLSGGRNQVDLIPCLYVAARQNFTRAAELLHTTQPAVSQHNQNLEHRMGIQFLDKVRSCE